MLRSTLGTRLGRIVVWGAAALAVPVLGIAWWLGSPLLFDKTVDEEFPRTVSATIPADMTRAEAEAVMEGMAKVEQPMTEAMTAEMQSAARVSAGSFRDADRFHTGSGRATLYALDGSSVLRLEDFSVTNGPALVVLLSAHPDPRSQGEMKGDGYIELGALKGNKGNHNYDLPSGADPSAYRSVVVYCKPFHVIFSVAPLSAADA